MPTRPDDQATTPTMARLHRLNARLVELARGDFINKSHMFPQATLTDRLKLTAASMRPASGMDRLRKKLNLNTLGSVALGPRDALANSVRRHRVAGEIMKGFLGNLSDIGPGEEWKHGG